MSWVKANWALLASTVAVVVVGTVLAQMEPSLAEAQWERSPGQLRDVEAAAWMDYVFMAAYAAWGWLVFGLIRRERPGHPAAKAGQLLVVTGALADAVENVFLLTALNSDARVHVREAILGAMRAFGLVKWGLLGAALLTLVTILLFRSWRTRTPPGLPTDRPDWVEWDPPAEGADARVGVCLSGGGIRSAAFCLGGLQALRQDGKLAAAKYLSAVSGGGYLAAGWAVSDASFGRAGGAATATAPLAWAPGSPEERWFRDHSSYLVPDTKGGFIALARLLAGLLVNLLILGLLLVAAARPVGWAMHAIHPNLRAADPTVLVRDDTDDVRIESVSILGTVDKGAKTRYEVSLAADQEGDRACFDLWPYEPGDRDACVNISPGKGRPAVVEVSGGRITVLAQPRVGLESPAPVSTRCDDYCRDVRAVQKDAFVAEQPTIKVVDDLTVDGRAPAAAQFAVDTQPRVSVKTGLAVMTWPEYQWWMWELVGGLLMGAMLVAIAVMTFRLRKHAEVGKAVAKALAGAGVVVFLVAIALPWLVVWLPRTLASIADSGMTAPAGSRWPDYLAPGTGALALLLVAIRQFTAGGSQGKETSGTGSSTPLHRRAWNALTKRSKELKWYELSPSKILVAVLSVVAVVVAFVNALQFAVANGWDGRLLGFVGVREYLPYWLFVPEWAKFAAAVVVLIALAFLVDAHSWSLYPFYKERLSSAFILRRVDTRAEPIPYEHLVPFGEMKKPDPGPQLIACCAVNLDEYGVVPPGRRAASFTFSSTEIGGPLVGYAKTSDYENDAKLPRTRRRDVTVPSAMAMSGAAFSPAMGKFNLGPVGSVLALANLRLGVWIPNPTRVHEGDRAQFEWRRLRRPHWVWFLRELANKYALDRRYVYVSDGGHWDNLGLVELLRRGCTEVYCISGAGDGSLSFGTIGEALALAREELGVEFSDFDPSPLRAPVKAADPTPEQRVLRRERAKDKASPFAAKPAVVGTFQFTYSSGKQRGVIYYVEADLTEAMPFDVHTFAEAEPDFPDDSTGDQVFNHRQFESYRALGYYQTAAAIKLPPPQTDGPPRTDAPPPTGL